MLYPLYDRIGIIASAAQTQGRSYRVKLSDYKTHSLALLSLLFLSRSRRRAVSFRLLPFVFLEPQEQVFRSHKLKGKIHVWGR